MTKHLEKVTVVYRRFLNNTDGEEMKKLQKELDQLVMGAIKEGSSDWDIQEAMDKALDP